MTKRAEEIFENMLQAVIDVNAEENVEAGLAEGRLREVNSE